MLLAMMRLRKQLHRRAFLKAAAYGATAGMLGCSESRMRRPPSDAALIHAGAGSRPLVPFGVQSGDISATSAMIWAASDRLARMRVRWSTSEQLASARTVMGPDVTPDTAFAGKLLVGDLPPGQTIFYEVTFEDLDRPSRISEPVRGRLRTAPTMARDIRVLWSGDTGGQGWGINLAWGGMRTYRAMLELEPDLFIHSGDTIYADNPFQPEVALPDGTVWKNAFVTEDIAKVAETLNEFRAHFRYNLLDENVRAFNASTAQLVQWDDHETVNNWYPGEVLSEGDPRYRQVRDVNVLAERARTAFLEWTPISVQPDDPQRIYRHIPYGPLLDVFMLDMRSYRNSNGTNVEPKGAPFLGSSQLEWLKQRLKGSRATWKIIGSDMPIGIIVGDGEYFENLANGDGPALGRELELAGLLRFIRDENITNVVWLTADVHYTAAHYYDPAQAQFTEFKPFWEFISGPLNAGSFGPNPLDNTFGPQVRFQKAPTAEQMNAAPSVGLQFFGEILISAKDQSMTVNLRDVHSAILFTQVIEPEQPA